MQTVVSVTAICAALPAMAADPKPPPLAGWLGVFPDVNGYQRTFKAPLVNKERTVYRQAATYAWTGGVVREATTTLAREPTFKTAHTPEALKRLGAEKVKAGERDAWTMRGAKEGTTKIVVPLGEDRAALMVEGTG